MEALIKKITDKTGISQDQATVAIHEVVSFLVSKLPPGLGEKVDSIVGSSKREALSIISDKSKELAKINVSEKNPAILNSVKQESAKKYPGYGRNGVTDFIEY